jgi:hypothetical protein
MLGVLLAGLVLALAACGGGGGGGGGGDRLTKSEYEKKVQTEGAKIRDAFQSTNVQNANDLGELAKNVKKGQKELRDAADRLDNVNPPKEIENDHNDLVDAMHSLADELDPFIKALEKKDTKGIQKAAQNLSNSSAVKKAEKAVADMKKKGYDLGAIGT